MAWSGTDFFSSFGVFSDGIRGFFSQRGFDREKWDAMRRDLQYEETPLNPVSTDAETSELPWEAIINILTYVGIALIIGLIAYAVVRIVMRHRFSGNGKKSEVESVSEKEEVTVLAPLDVLRKAYEKAKAEGDFREALRLLYRIVLKKLDIAGKLVADPDKTNREYLEELRGSTYASSFSDLTRIHEYRWYGESDVGEVEFNRLAPLFMAFIDKTDDEK